MTTDVGLQTPSGAAHVITDDSRRARISWGSVIAGTVLAMAIIIFLGLFGAAIGLWAVEPGGEADSLAGMGLASSIYFIIAQLVALAIGGYVAARMSGSHEQQSAILHGAIVWALATLLAAFLAMSTASALFFTTISAVKNSVQMVASSAQAVVPDELPDFSLPNPELSDLPPSVQTALRRQGITAENFKAEVREAVRNVISQREQDAAASVATDAMTDIIRTPSDAMSDINAAIDRLVGSGGVISDEDKAELMAVMERRFGISQSEAEAMFNRWEERAKEAYAEAEATLEEAQQEALQMGKQATDALAGASFAAFIASLLGLLAAGIGGMMGRHSHFDRHAVTR